MKKIFTCLGIVVAIWVTMPNALAQKATELYIPIGKSPGISGVSSMIGTIDSVAASEHTVYMHGSKGGSYEAKLNDETKIYLDKSTLKETNQMGSYADCKEGVYCEILYKSHTRKESGVAEWIKIRVTTP